VLGVSLVPPPPPPPSRCVRLTANVMPQADLCKVALLAVGGQVSIAPPAVSEWSFQVRVQGGRREPPLSGAVAFWLASVSGGRHSAPLQTRASRPMVTLRTAVASIVGFAVWAPRPLRTRRRFGQCLSSGPLGARIPASLGQRGSVSLCRSHWGGRMHNKLVETDTQQLGAARPAGDRMPRGAKPLRAAHRQR
jgi:hypothetical protein